MTTDAKRTALYRIYDAEEHMLYVGVGFNPFIRLDCHEAGTKWWERAARVDITWFDTRAEAEAEEKRVIEEFSPPGNTKRVPRVPPPCFVVEDNDDANVPRKQVAAYFSVSPSTVAAWEKRRYLIPAYRPDRYTGRSAPHYSADVVTEFALFWGNYRGDDGLRAPRVLVAAQCDQRSATSC